MQEDDNSQKPTMKKSSFELDREDENLDEEQSKKNDQ